MSFNFYHSSAFVTKVQCIKI